MIVIFELLTQGKNDVTWRMVYRIFVWVLNLKKNFRNLKKIPKNLRFSSPGWYQSDCLYLSIVVLQPASTKPVPLYQVFFPIRPYLCSICKCMLVFYWLERLHFFLYTLNLNTRFSAHLMFQIGCLHITSGI